MIRGALTVASRRARLASKSSSTAAAGRLLLPTSSCTSTLCAAAVAVRSISSAPSPLGGPIKTNFDATFRAMSAAPTAAEETTGENAGADADASSIAHRADAVTDTPLTKIVATIGPTSEQLPVLQDLVRSGLRVMRLNFSHATVEEVELRVKNLKLCKGRHGSASELPCYGEDGSPDGVVDVDRNVRAILLDTRGPEIRTGKLRDDHSGHETVHLERGDTVTLRTAERWAEEGSTAQDLYIDYPGLHRSVGPGMRVLLDDGAIALNVASVQEEESNGGGGWGSVVCTVANSGELRSRAGVNLPGAETDLPAMSEKDRVDIKYGMTKDVDFVAASFVQNAEGVREIRRYIERCAEELGWAEAAPRPLIISKIESVAALRNFDSILEESDGIMVARGDLGVEIPIQQVTNAQKEMVAACNAAGKPVIVATQMLESMAKNPRPTRAEVADVTNAVYDGADAVMLSGETAKGKYPREAIETMNDIIAAAESFVGRRTDLFGPAQNRFNVDREDPKNPEATLAKSAVTAAEERHASAIIVLTSHGTLPRLVSAYRPNVPIVAFCPSSKVAKQLILHRGIHPIIGLNGIPMAKRPVRAIRHAKEMGLVQSGDDVVVVTMEADEDMGLIATMKVATVGDQA